MDMSIKALRRQIKYVKDTITIKKRLHKDDSFEEDLVKEWSRWLPGGGKQYLLRQRNHPSPAL